MRPRLVVLDAARQIQLEAPISQGSETRASAMFSSTGAVVTILTLGAWLDADGGVMQAEFIEAAIGIAPAALQ